MKKLALLVVLETLFCSLSYSQSANWQSVETVFGRKGALQGDVFKITFPRTDLKVHVETVTVDPGLALTSWIAFKPTGDRTIIMGDLVLLENEVKPVMKELTRGSIEVTALHNHTLNESPRIMYMHFAGHGEAVKLAEVMKSALTKTATPPSPSTQEPSAKIDWSGVESVFGRTGQKKGNLLQLGIPRVETIEEHGITIPPSMGVATSINFQKVDNNAAATGDFVLLSSEVNPVIAALTEHGIAVTAIHSHMLDESPRLFFLHFWGYDEPVKLAQGLSHALEKTHVVGAK